MRREVSVIIVSYRHGAFLWRALSSLSRLGEALREVIVVDNAGDLDGTSLTDVDCVVPRLVDLGGNVGFSIAVNRAARQARGRVLMLLSPDAEVTEWHSDRLDRELDGESGAIGALTLNREGRPALSWGDFPGARALWRRALQRRPRRRREIFARLEGGESVAVEWVLGAAVLVPRSGFYAIGGLDPWYFSSGEDQDLGARLRRRGLKTVVSPAWVVRHVPRDPKGFRRDIRANNRRFVSRYGTATDRVVWSLAQLPFVFAAWNRPDRG